MEPLLLQLAKHSSKAKQNYRTASSNTTRTRATAGRRLLTFGDCYRSRQSGKSGLSHVTPRGGTGRYVWKEELDRKQKKTKKQNVKFRGMWVHIKLLRDVKSWTTTRH